MKYYATDLFYCDRVYTGATSFEIVAVGYMEINDEPKLVVVPKDGMYEEYEDSNLLLGRALDQRMKIQLYRSYYVNIEGVAKNSAERNIARGLGFCTYGMLYVSDQPTLLESGLQLHRFLPPEKMPNRIRSYLGW